MKRILRFLFGVLYLWLFVFHLRLSQEYSLSIQLFPFVMGALGLILIGVATYFRQRHKNVFDYEPVIFLRKERNGKQIRDIAQNLTFIGVWVFLFGITSYVLQHFGEIL